MRVRPFGHAAKVWLVILVAELILCVFISFSDWRFALEAGGLFTALFGLNLWVQMRQRVWYDNTKVCTRIMGKREPICAEIDDIQSITISHSWKRVANSKPLDELQIKSKRGDMIPISLRHVRIADLERMLDYLHERTGLAIPRLDGFR